jgi:hypothetical protein
MNTKQRFAIQSLIVTLVVNAILLAAIYFLVGDAIQAAGQTFLFFAIGALITLLLWLAIFFVGSRFIEREEPPEQEPAAAPAETPLVQPERVKPQEPSRSAEAGAVQMLAILQRQGRLIDFLQEDLRMYDDAQIGAAVRTIHEGCKQALAEHVRLEPVFEETEGSTVAVQRGFDTRAVRLTGDVAGEPPFRGALRHRGWRVVSIDLPQQLSAQDKAMIVAAAEVEVNA